jgi:hypothetical protein
MNFDELISLLRLSQIKGLARYRFGRELSANTILELK